MNKQLENASKEIGKVFENQFKHSDIGAFYIAVATDNTLAVSWNGDEEQKFYAIATFLCEHPDHISLFQKAINIAKEINIENKLEKITKQILN